MEQKNRLMIVVAVTILILGAILTSFGRSIFGLNTPDVVLPTGVSAPGSPSEPPSDEDTTSYLRVDVTPETVQDVIATLSRSDSYYRELSVETFWGEFSSVTQVQFWTDGGWSCTRQTLPSGAIRHDLVGDGVLYYWYDGSQQYLTTPADDRSVDLSQRIPTYETVLALEPELITDAGYGLSGDYPCVFAEVKNEELELLTRYWVSVDSGLLVSAEQIQNGQTVYRMTSYGAVQSPCPSSAFFQLPDGTVLHEIA